MVKESPTYARRLRPVRPTARELLTTFIWQSARIHEYNDVLWAANHYRLHYPPDIRIEICTIIALAAVGDTAQAQRSLRHAFALATTDDIIVTARQVTRLPLTPRSKTPRGVFRWITVALDRRRSRHSHKRNV